MNLQRLRVSAYSRQPSETERRQYEALISRLADRRRAIKISQRELEAQLGIGDGLLAKWENFIRLPGAFMLACWCEALGVTLVPVGMEDA